ncbi:MAG: hypothetical protein AAFO91_00005 [Bacteroidota bacterium]
MRKTRFFASELVIAGKSGNKIVKNLFRIFVGNAIEKDGRGHRERSSGKRGVVLDQPREIIQGTLGALEVPHHQAILGVVYNARPPLDAQTKPGKTGSTRGARSVKVQTVGDLQIVEDALARHQFVLLITQQTIEVLVVGSAIWFFLEHRHGLALAGLGVPKVLGLAEAAGPGLFGKDAVGQEGLLALSRSFFQIKEVDGVAEETLARVRAREAAVVAREGWGREQAN